MRDIKNEWMALQQQKRSRIQRIVQVDGHSVLRENNYTMQEAIHTLSGVSSSSSSSSSSSTKKTKQEYVHDNICLICWDGGELVCCDSCPASFHERCLETHGYKGRGALGFLKDAFVCPQHACQICGRRPSAAGGVLIACTECPSCFCEDHEPEEEVDLDSIGNDRWTELGMKKSRTAYYCRCSKHCKNFFATRVEKGAAAAVAQANKEIDLENEAMSKNIKKRRRSSKSFASVSVPNRSIIPPRHGKRGSIVDYDGHRW
jgi:hypothetical protein